MAAGYSSSPHNGWSPSGHGNGGQGPLTAAVHATGLSHHGAQ